MLTQGGFRNSLVGNKDDNFSQEVFWVTQMFWLKKNNNQFNLCYPIPRAPGNVRKPKLSWDWKLILFFSVLIICYAIWEALSHTYCLDTTELCTLQIFSSSLKALTVSTFFSLPLTTVNKHSKIRLSEITSRLNWKKNGTAFFGWPHL